MSTGRNMSTEQNKAVIRRWNDVVLNEKRVDRADELVTQDYVDRAALPGQAPGPGSLPPFTNAPTTEVTQGQWQTSSGVISSLNW